MKPLRHMFLLLGIGLLVIAAYGLHESISFQREALFATGRVIGIEERQRGDSLAYRAVIEVEQTGGKPFRFTASAGSKPGHYQVGERVDVLYVPAGPETGTARIHGFARLWGSPLVLLAMGVPLFLIGAHQCLAVMRKRSRKRRLQKHGRLLQCLFHEVVRDTRIKKSGVHPWVIRCRWADAENRRVHNFESEIIWFDPMRYYDGGRIRVWQDPQRPGNYHVDVSWLPTMGD